MREHAVTGMREAGVELHARQRTTQQARQRLLTHLKRLSPQVIAIKLQKIEGNEEDLRVVTAMHQLVKARHPTFIAAHGLTVDQVAARLQSVHRLDNKRVVS